MPCRPPVPFFIWSSGATHPKTDKAGDPHRLTAPTLHGQSAPRLPRQENVAPVRFPCRPPVPFFIWSSGATHPKTDKAGDPHRLTAPTLHRQSAPRLPRQEKVAPVRLPCRPPVPFFIWSSGATHPKTDKAGDPHRLTAPTLHGQSAPRLPRQEKVAPVRLPCRPPVPFFIWSSGATHPKTDKGRPSGRHPSRGAKFSLSSRRFLWTGRVPWRLPVHQGKNCI